MKEITKQLFGLFKPGTSFFYILIVGIIVIIGKIVYLIYKHIQRKEEY